MSNANAPSGLRPINQNGTPWSGQGTLCAVPAAQTGNIFLGDPVVALGGTDAFGCPLVGIATAGAGNAVLGSMLSISNGPAAGGNSTFTVTRDLPVYRQASILNYILVTDDPNCLFEIQEDSNGGAIAAATGGFANGNMVAGAGGSTVTGFSSWQLQSSSVSSSANTTYQLRLLGLVRGPDNAIGNYAKWIVRLNNPQLWSTTGV
jgi:hypothetical protein